MHRFNVTWIVGLIALSGAVFGAATRRNGPALRDSGKKGPDCCTTSTLPSISGRNLLADDGSLFTIQSFAYSPTTICENPSDPSLPLSSRYTNPVLIRRDGPWIEYVGANAIRLYEALYADGDGSRIGTTPDFIRDVAGHDLWVIMGTEIQPTACLAHLCPEIVDAHINLVREFRGLPNILMWGIGNEVNSHVEARQTRDWYELLDKIARAIKDEQGGSGPGIGPYICGILGEYNADGSEALQNLDVLAPNVDVWAINTFRGSTLGTLFEEIQEATTKPFWVPEMGIDSFDHRTMQEAQIPQANYATALWRQIASHCDVVCGADIGFYSDEWWKYTPAYDPCTQNPGGGAFGCAPDNLMDEEWLGVMKIRPGRPTDTVAPKLAYYAINRLWDGTASNACERAPFLADFNAPDCTEQCSNNYAGVNHAYCGGGAPQWNCLATGVSQWPGDTALQSQCRLNSQGGSFFVLLVTLFPDLSSPAVGSNLSEFDCLSFHARIGTETAHNAWKIRLEDDDGEGEWQNTSVSLPLLTNEFQQIRIPMEEFIGGPLPVVDLTRLAQVVFEPRDLDSTIEVHELDFVIDNLAIFSCGTDDQDEDWVPDAIDNCVGHQNPDQLDSDGNGIADVCAVYVVFEPPIAKPRFVMTKGRTLPIKFHFEDVDGTPIAGESAIRLEVRGLDNAGGVYAFDTADGSLRFDDFVYPPHYVANFRTRINDVTAGGEYRATVFQDGIQIGSVDFNVADRNEDNSCKHPKRDKPTIR